MPPKESDRLLGVASPFTMDNNINSNSNSNNNNNSENNAFTVASRPSFRSHLSLDERHMNNKHNNDRNQQQQRSRMVFVGTTILILFLVGMMSFVLHQNTVYYEHQTQSGSYQLVERQTGKDFFTFYDFYDGDDSLGSAGYNTYVSYQEALKLDLINVKDSSSSSSSSSNNNNNSGDDDSHVYLKTAPTKLGPRSSIRLEGKRRYNSGLFILDAVHTPAGCGQWPAFWLTDEQHWPDHGEIDVLEGINYQSAAKTALHTGPQCSMYAHVPDYAKTGHWDRATGIPDTFTGAMDFETSVPADNCWNLAAHQWGNQGCVAVHDQNDTLGVGLNKNGGGVYALQWDPENRYIRSWVFVRDAGIPSNLKDSMDGIATPDPDTWGLPYGYFAIGETTGCSADHFQNMHVVLNTAFCGTVAGNRFFNDCPEQAKSFNVSNDPVKSCNAWIKSEPEELGEAYWEIRGVYIYERAWEEAKKASTKANPSARN